MPEVQGQGAADFLYARAGTETYMEDRPGALLDSVKKALILLGEPPKGPASYSHPPWPSGLQHGNFGGTQTCGAQQTDLKLPSKSVVQRIINLLHFLYSSEYFYIQEGKDINSPTCILQMRN